MALAFFAGSRSEQPAQGGAAIRLSVPRGVVLPAPLGLLCSGPAGKQSCPYRGLFW